MDRVIKRIITLCMICIIALSLIACGNRQEKYSSPNGENTIIVEYDYASRPSVLYNGECIWEYLGSGFNEEVYFQVEWIDEDTVMLIYRDESHNGRYYEEFEIDL